MAPPKAPGVLTRAVGAAVATFDAAKQRFDGWQNLITGMGAAQFDKRLSSTVSDPNLVDWITAQALWRGSDMAARIIESYAYEMTREGFNVRFPNEGTDTASDGKDQAETIEAQLEYLEVNQRLRQAVEYVDAYGGAALLLGANDGAGDLLQPLNIKSVYELDFITTLAAFELYPIEWYSNPLEPRYGDPSKWRIMPKGVPGAGAFPVDVHESRLVVMQGRRTSRLMALNSPIIGWGDSKLTRCIDVLRDFDHAFDGTALLLHDFAPQVLSMEGLAEAVNDTGNTLVAARAQALALTRSIARVSLIDSKDKMERQTTPVGGLADLLDKMMLRVAACAEMPVSLLMGQAPAGLNATGASDIRFYYDRIRARQTWLLRPAINKIVQVLTKTEAEPLVGFPWCVDFAPLWQPTGLERAQERLAIAQADAVYLDRGVLTGPEVATSRFGGDSFDPETRLSPDRDLDAELEVAAEELATPSPDPTQLALGNQNPGTSPAEPTKGDPADQKGPKEG